MTPPIRMVSVPLDVATEAVNCMARAYERVHSLPRVSDTELANRVGVAKEALRIVLAAAPVREEGGANFYKMKAAIERAMMDERDGNPCGCIIEAGCAAREYADPAYAASGFIWAATDAVMSAIATREEAPAEAGSLEARPEREDYLNPALRAQPQAREEAQPVADAVEPIELAIAALKGHISAIQVAKRGGGSSSLITDCINSLPEIVRWVEGGLFNVEAAFEQYEATPPAPEAEKLRDHLEWIETVLTDPLPDYTARIATAREYISQTLAAAPGEAGE